MILVISCSHHPESRSRILANAAKEELLSLSRNVDFLDIRDLELPFCDGHSTYNHPIVMEAKERVQKASGILVSTPIYNYDVNATIKSFIEHTGKAWAGKPVGFLCAAGGKGSYMALVPFAGSLMLDFHCHVLPQHVYATNDQFAETTISDFELNQRVKKLVADICWLSDAVAKRSKMLNFRRSNAGY